MRRRAITGMGLPGACLVVAGWYLGFRSPLSYLTFFVFTALVFVTARRLARGLFPSQDGTGSFVRTGVIAFALVVLAGLVLGAEGLIGVPGYLALTGAAAAVAFTWGPPPRERLSEPARLPGAAVGVVALAVALVACMAALGLIQSPLTLYDSLSYHLVFPARWLQEHRISIIPTPFSDPAQAYQPSNGELVFLWLMAPFHGDLLARIGQLPFLALGAVALYGIARQLGARPEHAIYTPLFFLLARPVVEQAVGADVDLISTAAWAGAVYLGIEAARSGLPRDWLLWGVSAGLFLGTKYLAVIYMPLLAVLPFLRGLHRRWLVALLGVAALGLPWYVRNWIVAGSPIYPASLQVAGITIARGAYTRAAMAHSVFHASGLKAWLVVTVHAFGAPLFVFWAPCALAGSILLLWRHRSWETVYVIGALAVMPALEWLGLPSNIDARFLMPFVALGMVPLAFTFASNAALNAGLHAIYLAAAVWTLTGVEVTPSLDVPWYMNGWMSFSGLVDPRTAWWFAAAAVLGGAAFLATRHRAAWRTPAMLGLAGVASIALAVASDRACGTVRCSLLRISSTFIRPTMLDAWTWTAEHVHDARIANTGNNVPYPLFGTRLTNQVYYVNIDRHLDWRLHDYARARTRPGATLPSTPLARSSDELAPALSPPGPAVDAARPRFERLDGLRDAWVQNLKAVGITRLFVSQLSAYEIDYVWHNEAGFPIEDDWARADPRAFPLAYENPQVRIYDVSLP